MNTAPEALMARSTSTTSDQLTPTGPVAVVGWVITRDHLSEADWPSRVGTGQTEGDARQSGSMSVRVSRDLDAADVPDPVPFRLYDDDGEHYYSGAIARAWLDGDESRAFGPLDFGAADAGATELRYRGPDGWTAL